MTFLINIFKVYTGCIYVTCTPEITLKLCYLVKNCLIQHSFNIKV